MKAVLYDLGGLNVWLFHCINDLRSPWLDALMLIGTRLGDHSNFPLYLALGGIFGVVIATRRGGQPDIALTWLTALTVFSLGYVIEGQIIGLLKPYLDFPRPPLALPAGSLHIVGLPEFHHSLPSGHSAFAMLLAASFWEVSKRWIRIALAGFVLWVGVSRVSLGVHFPTDVLAGFLLSFGVVTILFYLARRVTRAERVS